MPLARLWAGRVYGTHIGNLFVKLEGPDEALTGTLRFAQENAGVVVYNVRGAFDGSTLTLTGNVAMQPPDFQFGDLTASISLRASGNLSGEWTTTLGSAGTAVLYPHDNPEAASAGLVADQLHTARHVFRAVDVTREQIIALADEVQRDFINARVVVTIATDTEEARFLDDYRRRSPRADQANLVKLYVSEPERTGANRIVSIEFGLQYNVLVTQGGDEAWVLGTLERLKREVRKFERVFTANAEWYGIGLKQLLMLSALAYMPSLDSFRDRAILIGAVLAVNVGLDWFHNRYFPNAAIYLTARREGLLAKVGPHVLSWVATIVGAVIAAAIATYLKLAGT